MTEGERLRVLDIGEVPGDIDAKHDHTHVQIIVTQPNGEKWTVDPTPFFEPEPVEFLERLVRNSVNDVSNWFDRQLR
ncbi:MAG: hypothetical protein K8S25_02040 [Alphaproteobacteria bacterium]|nr:hypothetical protein [Alphaproteobacteria bacterium]